MNLQELIAFARQIKMTPAQQEEQRRSFAFGNCRLANERITREMIDAAADRLGASDGMTG